MVASAPSPLLEMRSIEKSFPEARALKGVDLDLQPGEVLALLGENGAGKSTLIKILGGAHRPDAGILRINGVPTTIENPMDAQKAGIAVIYQEFTLVPTLSARENIHLGRERTLGFLRTGEESRNARNLIERLGISVDLEVPCSQLSVAQQQRTDWFFACCLSGLPLLLQ